MRKEECMRLSESLRGLLTNQFLLISLPSSQFPRGKCEIKYDDITAEDKRQEDMRQWKDDISLSEQILDHARTSARKLNVN